MQLKQMITIEQVKAEKSQLKDFVIRTKNETVIISPFFFMIRTITSKSDRVKRYGELHGMTMKNVNKVGFYNAVKRQLKKQKI